MNPPHLCRLLLYVDIWAASKLSHICQLARRTFHKIGLNYYLRRLPAEKALESFVKYYEWLPVQGSADWIAAKRDKKRIVIGGSELATVLGLNPYQKFETLIESKLGRLQWAGNINTFWGNVFEPILFAISDQILGTNTFETGSIPGLRNADGLYFTAYSPDRLGIVQPAIVAKVAAESVANLSKLLTYTKLPPRYSKSGIRGELAEITAAIKHLQNRKDNLVAVFEGKCPIARTPDGAVPTQYKPQIYMGACTIPIVNICIFTDGQFRRCSLNQWQINSPYYDRAMHWALRVPIMYPKRIGFVGVYANAQVIPTAVLAEAAAFVRLVSDTDMYENTWHLAYIIYKMILAKADPRISKMVAAKAAIFITNCDNDELLDNVAEEIFADIMDLGDIPTEHSSGATTLAEVLSNVVANRTIHPDSAPDTSDHYFAYYPDIDHMDKREHMIDFIKTTANYRCIGILPYKLFNLIHTPVLPKPTYMEDHRAVIEEAVVKIYEASLLPPPSPVIISNDNPTIDVFADIFDMPTKNNAATEPVQVIAPVNSRRHRKVDTSDAFADIF